MGDAKDFYKGPMTVGEDGMLFSLPAGALQERELAPQECMTVQTRAWPQGALPTTPTTLNGSVTFSSSIATPAACAAWRATASSRRQLGHPEPSTLTSIMGDLLLGSRPRHARAQRGGGRRATQQRTRARARRVLHR
jgi:hypothetical protein